MPSRSTGSRSLPARPVRGAVALVASLLAIVPDSGHARDASAISTPRSWTYQTYDRNAPNAAGYGGPGTSHIRLDGGEGDYRITIVAPGLATCYAAPLKAAVEQTATTLIITAEPRIPGCDVVRFVIKADGTGGRRETRVGNSWRWDRLERGLAARD